MRRHSDPRADYVGVATRLFADRGFHGVSLSVLATEAGVTKQALLHFFGTKERLYGEVLAALADRLHKQIDATAQDDPVEHLRAYFLDMVSASMTDPTDTRLVVRALLDSDETARRWPLKPYLDRLIDLTQAASPRTDMTNDAALARAYTIIGALQNLVVSSGTVTVIYGPATCAALADELQRFVENAVQDMFDPR